MADREYNENSANYGHTGPGGVGTEPSENNIGASKVKSDIKGSVTAVKDKVTEQTNELRGKLSEQASTISNQLTQRIDNARGKTSAGLRNTSQRIQNLALYMEEHDAKDMSDAVVRTSKELVRKHPGKSLLAGLLFGMLVGRIFSMGSARRF